MLATALGNDLFASLAQSYAVTAGLSKRYGDFSRVTATLTLPAAYFGLAREEAEGLARNEILKLRDAAQRVRLRLSKLREGDLVPCASIVLGDPVVLAQVLPRLAPLYYVMPGVELDEGALGAEIDFILQHNRGVRAVVARGRFYRALLLNGEFNGK